MLSLNSVLLRTMTVDDLERVRIWRNADFVRKYMYTDHIISREEHDKWYRSVSDRSDREYLIVEWEGRPMGLVSIYDIDKRNGTCFWAFYIGEADRPRGLGSIMEILALDRMTQVWDVRKISCEVLSFNESVIRIHKKFGFKEEGRFKAQILKGDTNTDVVRLALFADEWENARQRVIGRMKLSQ